MREQGRSAALKGRTVTPTYITNNNCLILGDNRGKFRKFVSKGSRENIPINLRGGQERQTLIEGELKVDYEAKLDDFNELPCLGREVKRKK